MGMSWLRLSDGRRKMYSSKSRIGWKIPESEAREHAPEGPCAYTPSVMKPCFL